MLAKFCVAGRGLIGGQKEKLCFHPFDVFKSLQKHRPDALLRSLFSHWPATEDNPFVLPVCIYSCIQSGEPKLPYCTGEYIRIAETQCARQYPGVPLLVPALLFTDAPERSHAAHSLVALGVDPNEIACTARLKEFYRKRRSSSCTEIFARLDELTPLALSVTLKDHHLVRKLIHLGANPCLVCFQFSNPPTQYH